MFERITFDSKIIGGRACLRGMRIPVSVIVGQIAYGATIEEVLDDYLDLEPEDITQALTYTAWLAHEVVLVSRRHLLMPSAPSRRHAPPGSGRYG